MNCVVGWPGSWPRICSNKCCLRIVRLPGARFGRPVTLLSGKMRPEVDYCCRGSGFVGQNRAVPPDWVACQHDSTASLTDSALSSRKTPFALPQRQHCISQSPLSPIARCCNCFSFTSDTNYLPQHVPQRSPSVDARCRRRQCCQPSLRREYLLSPRPDRASHRIRRKTSRSIIKLLW